MILLLSLLLVAGILGWLYWRYRVPAQVYDLLRTPSLSELAPIGKAPGGPGRGVGILGVLPCHSLEESLRKLS